MSRLGWLGMVGETKQENLGIDLKDAHLHGSLTNLKFRASPTLDRSFEIACDCIESGESLTFNLETMHSWMLGKS